MTGPSSSVNVGSIQVAVAVVDPSLACMVWSDGQLFETGLLLTMEQNKTFLNSHNQCTGIITISTIMITNDIKYISYFSNKSLQLLKARNLIL